MPYKHATDKKKIPRNLDRRVTITEATKKVIKKEHRNGTAQRAIARLTGVSRRSIGFILFPETLATAKAQYKERRLDQRYYNKNKHTAAVREHRRYKQSIKDKLM